MATDSLATEWVFGQKLEWPPAFTSRLDPDGRHVQANGSARDLDQILDRLTAAEVVLKGAYVGNAVQRNQARCVLQPAVQDLLTVFREDWRELGRSDRLTVATVASDVAEQIRVITPVDWSLRSESLLRVITGGTEVVKTVAADSPAVSGEILAKIISNTPVGGVERWYDPFAKLPAATVHSVVGNFLRAASVALEAREFEVDWVVRQELHRVVDYLTRGAGNDPDFRRTARQLHHALRERVDWSDPPEVESFFFNDAMLCVADGRVWKAIERLEARADALERLDAPALIVGNRMLIERLKSGGRGVEPPVGFEHLGAMLGAGFLPDFVVGKGINGTSSGPAFGSHLKLGRTWPDAFVGMNDDQAGMLAGVRIPDVTLPDGSASSLLRNRVTVYLSDFPPMYSPCVPKQEVRPRQKVESPDESSEQEGSPRIPEPPLLIEALRQQMQWAAKESGRTQEEIGQRMNPKTTSPQQNVSQLLREIPEPGVLTLARFAEATGITLLDLLLLRSAGDFELPKSLPPAFSPEAFRATMLAAKEQAGKSLAGIGHSMGWAPQAVDVLLKKSANPSIITVAKFAKAVNMSLLDLIRKSTSA